MLSRLVGFVWHKERMTKNENPLIVNQFWLSVDAKPCEPFIDEKGKSIDSEPILVFGLKLYRRVLFRFLLENYY